MKPLPAIAAGAVILTTVSCARFTPPASEPTGYLAGLAATQPLQGVSANPAEASSFWDGDGIPGDPFIRINLGEQKAYFYKSGQLVGVSAISSGSTEHVTPPGKFKVSQKDIDHESSLYGRIIDVSTGDVIVEEADTRIHKPEHGQEYQGAPMHYFLRFNGGIGMHAGHLPGYPASHGCIRMPRHMAQKFYENAEIGTPVVVE